MRALDFLSRIFVRCGKDEVISGGIGSVYCDMVGCYFGFEVSIVGSIVHDPAKISFGIFMIMLEMYYYLLILLITCIVWLF